MSKIEYPPSLEDWMRRLEGRVSDLETAPRATLTAIKEGRMVILDNTGAQRGLFGKDPADGSYGLKNYDAAGNVIFDSTGLVNVMSVIGEAHGFAGSFVTASTIPATLTDGATTMSLTFVLARQVRVVLWFSASASMNAGSIGYVSTWLDGVEVSQFGAGQLTSVLAFAQNANPGYAANAMTKVLAAGSHTILLKGSVSAGGGTMTVNSADMIVAQLGG